MQKDGERRIGAEESCLVNGCEALHLVVQKSAAVTKTADDGKGDGGQNADER